MEKVIINRLTKPNNQIVQTVFEKANMSYHETNANFFSNQNNIFLTAYLNGSLSGFVYAYLLECPHMDKNQLFLYSIDVFSEYQKRGVGSALIKELIKIMKEKNCIEMFVLTNESNEAAKKLYSKTGGKRENLDDVMFVFENDCI